jgi:hypothetical protein
LIVIPDIGAGDALLDQFNPAGEVRGCFPIHWFSLDLYLQLAEITLDELNHLIVVVGVLGYGCLDLGLHFLMHLCLGVGCQLGADLINDERDSRTHLVLYTLEDVLLHVR